MKKDEIVKLSFMIRELLEGLREVGEATFRRNVLELSEQELSGLDRKLRASLYSASLSLEDLKLLYFIADKLSDDSPGYDERKVYQDMAENLLEEIRKDCPDF